MAITFSRMIHSPITARLTEKRATGFEPATFGLGSQRLGQRLIGMDTNTT